MLYHGSDAEDVEEIKQHLDITKTNNMTFLHIIPGYNSYITQSRVWFI